LIRGGHVSRKYALIDHVEAEKQQVVAGKEKKQYAYIFLVPPFAIVSCHVLSIQQS
jgi:hypothetical protein